MEETVWSIADNITEMTQNVDNNVSLETTAALPTTSTISVMQPVSLRNSIILLTVSSVGIVINTVVLAVLILARREYGSTVNTLIINQCAMDLYTCVSIVLERVVILTYVIAYRGNQLVDNIVCITLGSILFPSIGVTSEKIGLVVITLERYFKIVHAVAHRKHYRNWMTKVGVALPWIAGACVTLFPALGATRVVNGRCLRVGAWPNAGMAKVK